MGKYFGKKFRELYPEQFASILSSANHTKSAKEILHFFVSFLRED